MTLWKALWSEKAVRCNVADVALFGCALCRRGTRAEGVACSYYQSMRRLAGIVSESFLQEAKVQRNGVEEAGERIEDWESTSIYLGLFTTES